MNSRSADSTTAKRRPLRVLHVITGLGDGGAQSALFRLCTAPDQAVEHAVVSLDSGGKYVEPLRMHGVRTHVLGMTANRPSLSRFVRLCTLIRRERPDVLQTWMYHANLLGTLAALLVGQNNLFWNIRHTDLDKRATGRSTILVNRICAILSGLPDKIVACAQDAVATHVRLGYRRDKFTVIPNGLDVDEFAPDAAARSRMRAELGLAESIPLVGLVGRWNPQKDHKTLIAAIAEVRRDWPEIVLALAGDGCTRENADLIGLIEAAGLSDAVRLLGPRNDIPTVMNGLDLHVLSSSHGEAFPNVVAEAMACGTPCVVTEVGDAAEIVGATGWCVAPARPSELAATIRTALSEIHEGKAWARRRESARNRVVTTYSRQRMVARYLTLWSRQAGIEIDS